MIYEGKKQFVWQDVTQTAKVLLRNDIIFDQSIDFKGCTQII
jgi:hypothetical protein